MRRIIAGNWKMNGLRADVERLMQPLRALPAGLPVEVVVCPPATILQAVAALAEPGRVAVGGQDCRATDGAAHTGDISAQQLRDAGATWVILGHSERRAGHGETDALVHDKVAAAAACGLTPIVCVGETADQRGAGNETEVVGWQISGSLPKDFEGVVAYEPVWAIGTGRRATPEEVAPMHAFIREELLRELGEHGRGIPILYGGSVRADNAASLQAVPEPASVTVLGALLGAGLLLRRPSLRRPKAG